MAENTVVNISMIKNMATALIHGLMAENMKENGLMESKLFICNQISITIHKYFFLFNYLSYYLGNMGKGSTSYKAAKLKLVYGKMEKESNGSSDILTVMSSYVGERSLIHKYG